MLTIFLLIGFFSMGMRFASSSAGPSYQTHYNIGYNDGIKNAECDFKHCHGHGYDRTVPNKNQQLFLLLFMNNKYRFVSTIYYLPRYEVILVLTMIIKSTFIT
jgi:hypothetical protein